MQIQRDNGVKQKDTALPSLQGPSLCVGVTANVWMVGDPKRKQIAVHIQVPQPVGDACMVKHRIITNSKLSFFRSRCTIAVLVVSTQRGQHNY